MAIDQKTDLDFIKLDVIGRLDQIQEKLLQIDPMLPVHLSAIHSTLIQYEELVHLLSDEQIAQLIAGQKKHLNVELVKEITEKKRAPRASKTTVDDL